MTPEEIFELALVARRAQRALSVLYDAQAELDKQIDAQKREADEARKVFLTALDEAVDAVIDPKGAA